METVSFSKGKPLRYKISRNELPLRSVPTNESNEWNVSLVDDPLDRTCFLLLFSKAIGDASKTYRPVTTRDQKIMQNEKMLATTTKPTRVHHSKRAKTKIYSLKSNGTSHSTHLYLWMARPTSGQISSMVPFRSDATTWAQMRTTNWTHLWWTRNEQSVQMYDACTTLQMMPEQWSQNCRAVGVCLRLRVKWWPSITFVELSLVLALGSSSRSRNSFWRNRNSTKCRTDFRKEKFIAMPNRRPALRKTYPATCVRNCTRPFPSPALCISISRTPNHRWRRSVDEGKRRLPKFPIHCSGSVRFTCPSISCHCSVIRELGMACDLSLSSPDKEDVDELPTALSDSLRVNAGKFWMMLLNVFGILDRLPRKLCIFLRVISFRDIH